MSLSDRLSVTPLPSIRRKRRAGPTRAILFGALAGAAGTTALDAVTYLDMTVRGRAASQTPQGTVEAVSEKIQLPIPGEGKARENRIAGLGGVAAIVTGAAVGALAGLSRSLGWKPGPVVESLAVGGVAMLVANAGMAALAVTDPRTWTAADWASDVLPHVAYGAVTVATLEHFRGLD
ncbi:MAG: hypothetical protein QOK10_383 [Pseudonocardiales bacterium]|jgi:hypothetical protein|nr:hypothetical protein [Pseudonocardiales bacterium]